MLCGHQAYAQILIDPVVATQKGIINGALGVEQGAIATQTGFLVPLVLPLKEDNKKRTSVGNIKSSLLLSTTLFAITSTEKKIETLKKEIQVLKSKPSLYILTHGIKDIEGALITEERYLKNIKKRYVKYLAGIPLSGDAGDNYLAFMKLLIRTKEGIRPKVMELDLKIKNLYTINKIL